MPLPFGRSPASMQPSAVASEEPVTTPPLLAEQQQHHSSRGTPSEPPPPAPTALSLAYSKDIPYSSYEQSLLQAAPLAFPSLDAFAERESLFRSQDRKIKKQKQEKAMKQQG